MSPLRAETVLEPLQNSWPGQHWLMGEPGQCWLVGELAAIPHSPSAGNHSPTTTTRYDSQETPADWGWGMLEQPGEGLTSAGGRAEELIPSRSFLEAGSKWAGAWPGLQEPKAAAFIKDCALSWATEQAPLFAGG